MSKRYINRQNCLEYTGYTPDELVRFTGIHAYTNYFTFEICGTNTAPRVIVDSKDGNVHISRTYLLEVMVVENERFEVAASRNGTGRKIFAEQIRELKRNGFTHMTCIAQHSDGFNGHYSWARFGYIIDEEEIQDIAEHFRSMDYDCQEFQPHRIVLDTQHKEWWRLNGITWSGTFDLADGSESMVLFEYYMEECHNNTQ